MLNFFDVIWNRVLNHRGWLRNVTIKDDALTSNDFLSSCAAGRPGEVFPHGEGFLLFFAKSDLGF